MRLFFWKRKARNSSSVKTETEFLCDSPTKPSEILAQMIVAKMLQEEIKIVETTCIEEEFSPIRLNLIEGKCIKVGMLKEEDYIIRRENIRRFSITIGKSIPKFEALRFETSKKNVYSFHGHTLFPGEMSFNKDEIIFLEKALTKALDLQEKRRDVEKKHKKQLQALAVIEKFMGVGKQAEAVEEELSVLSSIDEDFRRKAFPID